MLIGMRLLIGIRVLLKKKKQIRGGCPLKRGRLLSTVLNILLFDRVSSRFVKSNCLEINSQSVTLMVPYLLD